MVTEEEFIKSVIKIIYESKYSTKEWDENSVCKTYEWLDIFQFKFLVPLKEYIKNNDDSYTTHIINLWNDTVTQYSLENKLPPLDLDFKNILNSTIDLKEYVFGLWINNLFITENKFNLFLTHHINNLNKININSNKDKDNNSLANSLINSFKDIIGNNSFNSILIEYNRNSLNQLQNNVKSIYNNNNSNNKITSFMYNIQIILYKNDNIKIKASAQLLLKHLVKIQNEYNSNNIINPDIINILDSLFLDESTLNVLSWIILIIFEKEIYRKEQNNPPIKSNNNSGNEETNIYELIYNGIMNLINNAKRTKKILYFLRSDRELLVEISKYDQEFYRNYYNSIFLCLDYYLFNTSNKKPIDPVYLNSISDSLYSLNQIDNIIQHQVNQRLLGTNFLKMNDQSKDKILEMLLGFKNTNSIVNNDNK